LPSSRTGASAKNFATCSFVSDIAHTIRRADDTASASDLIVPAVKRDLFFAMQRSVHRTRRRRLSAPRRALLASQPVVWKSNDARVSRKVEPPVLPLMWLPATRLRKFCDDFALLGEMPT
jgi:hypothetical protein